MDELCRLGKLTLFKRNGFPLRLKWYADSHSGKLSNEKKYFAITSITTKKHLNLFDLTFFFKRSVCYSSGKIIKSVVPRLSAVMWSFHILRGECKKNYCTTKTIHICTNLIIYLNIFHIYICIYIYFIYIYVGRWIPLMLCFTICTFYFCPTCTVEPCDNSNI